jgi:glycosyltransferase involved in cell wall biosynthesis
MRLAYLNNNYYGEGTFHRCFQFAKRMAQRGHDVSLYTITNKFPSLRTVREEQDGVHVIKLPALSRRRDYLMYIWRPLLNTYKLLPKENFDIIHAFSVAEPVTGFPAIKSSQRGQTLIVDWDDWYSKGGIAEQKPFQKVIGPMTEKLEEQGALAGKTLTVVSEALEKRAQELGIDAAKIFRIGNGADLETFKPGNREESRKELQLSGGIPVLVYMGVYNKAIPTALRAFRSLLETHKNLVLVCLGKIDIKHNHLGEERELVQWAVDHPQCLMPGYVDVATVQKYLAAADVLLLPMEDNIIEQARFPIRLGDYLASGRTIVASEVGEVGRVIRENLCGLLAQNQEQFTRRVDEVLRNPERRGRLEQLARHVAETKLNWDDLTDRLEEVYKTTLQGPPKKKKKK